MLDTIRIIYSWKNFTEKEVTDAFLKDNYYPKIKTTLRTEMELMNQSTEVIEGNFNGFKFWSNYYGICMEGSLWKFYHGNNDKEFTNDQIKLAFEKLQSRIPTIDWSDAHFTKLEFGLNFVLKNSADVYCSFIMGKKGKKKTIVSGKSISVAIGNTNNQMSFYNKSVESNNESGENILRIEKKTNSESFRKKHFHSKSPKLSYLINNLNLLYKIWYDDYVSIEKDYSPVMKNIYSFNDLQNSGITNLGYNICKQTIKSSYNAGTLSKNKFNYCNRKLAELMKTSKVNSPENHPLVELDQKVMNYILSINGEINLED
ncbi:hypothetical protein ACAW74_06450 [Fibrella sp. WM1]|uniref:hypothetical protein n=1 Tax=Fibrella musci TaxID=3242485 RepID=UPI003522392E